MIGEYPMMGIEWLVEALGNLIRDNMSEGPLKDLMIDGIIGGVGGVIVFLPNILILYFCISLMEDSGYMARAAFIMDKIMHKMGLHGKSFIPLIMGFGCNVPAIMASRTIENRKSRLITMLVNPLMSCSAVCLSICYWSVLFSQRMVAWSYWLFMLSALHWQLSWRVCSVVFWSKGMILRL